MKAWTLEAAPTVEGAAIASACDVPAEQARDDELLVRPQAVSLAGADFALLGAEPQRVPGHAGVGIVESAGAAYGSLQGATVLFGEAQGCGECPRCRRGQVLHCQHGTHLCTSSPGALAQQVRVKGRWAVPLDDTLPLRSPLVALVGRELLLAYAQFLALHSGAGDLVFAIAEGYRAKLLEQIATFLGVRLCLLSPQTTGELLTENVEEAEKQSSWEMRPRLIIEQSYSREGGALVQALVNPGSRIAIANDTNNTTGAAQNRLSADALPLGYDLTLRYVSNGHPDLLAELAAFVHKGEIDLAGIANTVEASRLESQPISTSEAWVVVWDS